MPDPGKRHAWKYLTVAAVVAIVVATVGVIWYRAAPGPCVCDEIPLAKDVTAISVTFHSKPSETTLELEVHDDLQSKVDVLKPLAEGCVEPGLKWAFVGLVKLEMHDKSFIKVSLFSGPKTSRGRALAFCRTDGARYYVCWTTTVDDYEALLLKSSDLVSTKKW